LKISGKSGEILSHESGESFLVFSWQVGAVFCKRDERLGLILGCVEKIFRESLKSLGKNRILLRRKSLWF
jgi:hypothetical protein